MLAGDADRPASAALDEAHEGIRLLDLAVLSLVARRVLVARERWLTTSAGSTRLLSDPA